MTRIRSKDALTAATTSFLKPYMAQHGLAPLSIRVFARIRGEVLHHVTLQRSAWGGRQFCVNYSAQSLLVPSDAFVLGVGGRLNRKGAERWWPSSTHDEADSAMQEVVRLMESQAIRLFKRTSSTQDYLAVITSRRLRRIPYHEMARACCYAWVGKKAPAKRSASDLIKAYRSVNPAYKGPHIDQGIHHMQELMGAIDAGSQQILLREWMASTIEALGLGSLSVE